MRVQHRRISPWILSAIALSAAIGCESERDDDTLVVVDAASTGVFSPTDAAAVAPGNPTQGDAGLPSTSTMDAASPPRVTVDAATPPVSRESDSQVARPADAAMPSECAPLPASFALEGCGLPALCHLEQTGCTWQAKCGAKKLVGQATGETSTFTLEDGRTCTGKLTGGVLKGGCTGGDAGMCAFSANADPLPTPFCVELPSKLSALDVCAQPPPGAKQFVAQSCDVIQSGCAFQASCNGGADVISGKATATGLRWDTSFNYRCTGTLEGGKIVGTCTQRGVAADAGTPGSCTLAADAPAEPGLTCAQELPTTGFVMKGCTLEGTICHLSQRGCIWQAACGKDVFSGRVTEPGVYRFTTPMGAKCTARVEAGAFVGRCEWGNNESCEFGAGTPAPISGCYAMPTAGFKTAGCAGAMTCDVVQSGCKWQSNCSTGGGGTLIYAGESKPNGITFPGRGEYDCWAYQEMGTNRLVGGCSVAGVEVSECSARVEGGSLVLTPR
jgi:hypothetical protein